MHRTRANTDSPGSSQIGSHSTASAPAASAAAKDWPDGVDATITAFYLALVFGVPLAGYVLMALDFRAYLRSLRRALAVVADWVPTNPYWALRDRPPCLITLNLFPPVTEAEVMVAYRERVKQLHPDRGGTEHRLEDRHRQLEMQIRTISLEEIVLVDCHDHEQIAGRTAKGAAFALARQTEPHPGVDTGGNGDLE